MEEYLIRRDQASLIAKFQTSGNGARSLLADPVVIECPSKRGIKELLKQQERQERKQNHQAKLRKQLQDIQLEKARSESEIEKKRLRKSHLLELQKQEKFGHVKAKVFDDHQQHGGRGSSSVVAAAAGGGEDHHSIRNNSTVISSVDSLSSLSLVEANNKARILLENKMIGNANNTNHLHGSFGRVPDYILRRKIEEGKKLKVLAEQQDEKESSSSKNDRRKDRDEDLDHQNEKENFPLNRRRFDKKKLRAEYEMKINSLRDSLRKLPFGLQSQGSIRKREALEVDLRRIEQEQRTMMKKYF
jgi:hypothetical protein